MGTFFLPNAMTGGQPPTWQQTLLHATTAAELADSYKPSTFDVSIMVDSTASIYQWEPQSVAVVDNVNVIGHKNSGTEPGRWLVVMVGTGSVVGGGDMFAYETIALQEAAPGPLTREIAWNLETRAAYIFIAGSALTVDNFVVLSVTGGVPGQWILKSDSISLASIDNGVTDDWPRLNLAMIACAYKAKIVLRAGNWLCSTTGEVPAGTHLTTEGPGVIITANMTTGAFNHFVFKKFVSLAATGTLAATPAIGATSVSIATTAPAVGNWIWLGQGANTPFIAQQFEVKTVAGVGPFTVTLDRPIRVPVQSGDPARVITAQVRDIILDGNGATIEGTGDAAFKILGGYRCHVRNWLITTDAAGGIFTNGCTFDVATLDSSAEDVDVDCTLAVTPSSQAHYFESCERFTARKLTANGAGYAIAWWDCVDCFQEDCSGDKSTTAGTIFTGNGGDTPFVGSTNIVVKGGGFHNSPNIGVAWTGSNDCRVYGVECDNNFTGFSFDATSLRVRMTDCVTKRNTTYGVQVVGADGQIVGHTSISDAIGIFTSVAVAIERLTALTYASRAIYIDVAIAAQAKVTVRGGRLSSTVSGSLALDCFGPASVVMEDVRIENAAVDASQNAIVGRASVASVITLRDVMGVESSASGGYLGQAGATLRSYGRTSLLMTVPITINAAGYYNRGQIVSGGANVAQAVPFPDLKSDEIPKIIRIVDGGVPAIMPVVVRTPGTGWTEKYAAGDTSTYYHEV